MIARRTIKVFLLFALLSSLFSCAENRIHGEKDLVQGPVAKASAFPSFGDSPLEVTFDAGGSSDKSGGPLQFLWNFDDGTISTDESTKHTFTIFGTYMVELTVASPDGLEDTDWVVIIVN
jgi:PKD repeat protein